MPNTKNLLGVLRCQSSSFVEFIERCLDWNPETRITPYEALVHDWIIEGLPPKVLQHHKRMLGVIESGASSNSNSQTSKSNKSLLQKPPKTTKNGALNHTCLLSDAMNSHFEQFQKHSLNKTGMVMVNADEDMVDCVPVLKEDEEEPEKEKSKTTNVADLLKEMQRARKKNEQGKSKAFENTYDTAKLKKNSFFS